jgi:large conductance mechanosensitive channel
MMHTGEKAKRFGKAFMAFATKGNVMDMAVGVMIGGAFGKIVSSLVSDIMMPLISLVTGGIHLTGLFVALDGKMYPSAEAANTAGAATLNYGVFMQTVIDFIIIALCIFMFLRVIRRKDKPQNTESETAVCAQCLETIKKGASRCPHCTSPQI